MPEETEVQPDVQPEETPAVQPQATEGSITTTPVIERGEHLRRAGAAAEFIKKYGFDDYDTFLSTVRSDGLLAGRVIDDLLAEKFS